MNAKIGMSMTIAAALAGSLLWALATFQLFPLSFDGRTENTAVPAPTYHKSGPISLTPDGRTLLVANPESNSLTLVDIATQTVLAEIPVGTEPSSVAALADGTAVVANQGSDTLSLVDLDTQVVTAVLPVGSRPVGVALSPDGRFLAVSELGDDRVRFLNAASLTTLSVQSVADRPYGLAFTPDGRRLLVTHLLSGDVTMLTVTPYIAYLPLIQMRNADFGLGNIVPTSNPQSAIPNPQSQIPTWPNVAPAPAVLVNAAGTRAYLPQTMANGQGLNTRFDATVFPKVSVINLETESHQTSEHISLPETDQPVGLPWDTALSPDESELWVVNAASNDVSVIDISSPTQPQRRAHILVGDNPRGIVISPDGATAYVNNTLAGTVSVIDTSAYTVTAVIPVTTIPLPPCLLRGKQFFHSSATSDLARAKWISCNTCHIEGEQDGRTWLLQFTGTIPPGATPVITRNTTSLLGMVQTYPLRWSGEWDESADSEFSIRFEQFGSGLIAGAMNPTLGAPNQGRSVDLDCLAAFIDSLAVPERSHTLTPAEQRGQAIFESAETGCADCHPPPLYTDLQAHDVGTAVAPSEWFGPEINTPSLRFLFDSAPYLHDGRAATLLNVLTTTNPTDQHGITSQLTDDQLNDLTAFLLALPFAE